jgi:hypothetical protein
VTIYALSKNPKESFHCDLDTAVLERSVCTYRESGVQISAKIPTVRLRFFTVFHQSLQVNARIAHAFSQTSTTSRQSPSNLLLMTASSNRLKINNKSSDELMAYIPYTILGISNNTGCTENTTSALRICCRGNVFTEPLPSKGRVFRRLSAARCCRPPSYFKIRKVG